MSFKELVILHVMVATLVLLTLETFRVLSLPTTANLESIVSDLNKAGK